MRNGQTVGAHRQRRGWVALWTVIASVAIASMILAGCGTDPNQGQAQQNQAKLDHELHHAKSELGIPESMLKPIETQEQSVASGAGGWNYSYKDASYHYQLLYTQLVGIEQTAGQTLKQQASADIAAFTNALNARRSQGFKQIDAYQGRLQQVIGDYNNAQMPGDFAKVDAEARANTEALNALWPAYQKLQAFQQVLLALRNAGLNSALSQVEYQQDVDAFRNASSADRYQKLVGVIDGQINQLVADQAEALPYVGNALLSVFQARIQLLKQYGDTTDAATFQQQYTQDTRELAQAHSLADYLTLSQQINKQSDGMSLPLIRAQAHYDFNALAKLVTYANTKTMTNPYDGTQYPLAYEYADYYNGIGDAQSRLAYADSVNSIYSYAYADDDINILTTNLRALLDDYGDSTPHYLPHQTDLQLMRQYGVMQGKTIVVSLREQTARFYENGKLVYWSFVTTGRPEKPSVPGLHYALLKLQHTMFTSPEPKGSPLWYAPTPINFAIEYSLGGFFLHDAWWRAEFGPYTNLPHYDPAAFNGGSHGCINFPLNNMAWVYNWTPDSSPIIVY
ncbi:MAG: L,D-transpeptidase [Ktedonobacterales bacterium]